MELIADAGSRPTGLATIFILGPIPASLLPYPVRVLEAAINIMGKHYFDLGDHEQSEFIKSMFGHLMFYCNDDKAIEHLLKTLTMPELGAKAIILDKLREYRATAQP